VKRLVALLIPLLLTGGPALAAKPPPSHGAHRTEQRASRVRQPAPKLPVAVSLTSVGPGKYLTAKSVLRVRGQLINQSGSDYQRVSVRLLFSSQPMTSRGELEAYADGKGPEPARAGPDRQLTASLPADGQQRFALYLPARQMGLATFGVYPISVEVYNGLGALLGRQRTLVTYYSKTAQIAKTKVAWVWPVIDQPHRSDDDTFLDGNLERQFGGGRLAGLVAAAAHTSTPVSWLLDPSLVDDAAQMASDDGYTIKSSTKDSVHRYRNVAASSWLTSLHAAIGDEQVIATPYADPDVMALAQHHMPKDVKAATDAGVRSLTAAGVTRATTSVSAPPDGIADQATLTALAASGARTVLLSSAILPDLQAQTYTPDPLVRKNVSGKAMNLIAYDDTLRKVLDMDTSEPGGTVLAEQRFLAETAMITGEKPYDPRTIVITPPRRWDPSPAFAKAVLSDSSGAPWLRPVTLDNVESVKPVSRTFQPPKNTSGLSGTYLRQVRELDARIDRFTSILRPQESAFTLGVSRAESSAWNGHSRRGKALRQRLDAELKQDIGKIEVLNDGITLFGRSARIPITISNGLSDGTVVVTLHAYSKNDTRLRVNDVDRTLTLAPGHKDQVTLNMKAAANGPAYVGIELLTPDGLTFGDTHLLRVNASGYGGTALLITGVSLAVLFLGIGVRVLRRRAERAEESV
jgi:hypothetical protein